MNIITQYHPLFLVGVALMAVSAVGTVIAFITLRISGKSLRAKLEAEYGAKKH